MDQLKQSFEDIRFKDLTRAISIPIPAAMFGILVSFMFGWTVGSMMSRKHAVPEHEGHESDWKHVKELKKHHHHGDGPPCRCKEGHKKASEHAE